MTWCAFGAVVVKGTVTTAASQMMRFNKQVVIYYDFLLQEFNPVTTTSHWFETTFKIRRECKNLSHEGCSWIVVMGTITVKCIDWVMERGVVGWVKVTQGGMWGGGYHSGIIEAQF